MVSKSLILKEISTPINHNAILAIVIFAAIWALFIVRDDNSAKFQILIVTDLFYLFWALIYHVVKKDLNFKIFAEYGLFFLLVLFIAQIIFYWR
jgi:hypothetical protein